MGQFSRQIGWKTSRGGKRVQHKFRLGQNLKEAQRREQKLIELWEQVEKTAGGAPPLWDDTSLEIGTQLARGICPNAAADSSIGIGAADERRGVTSVRNMEKYLSKAFRKRRCYFGGK